MKWTKILSGALAVVVVILALQSCAAIGEHAAFIDQCTAGGLTDRQCERIADR